jgi:TonB family protein
MSLLKLNHFRPIRPQHVVGLLVCFCLCALVSAAFAQSSTDKTTESQKSRNNRKIKISTGIMGSLPPTTQPVYPPFAKAARISGTVVLEATISKTGIIEDLHVVSGPPLLQRASLDAVKTWRYRPYVLNGVPMEAKTTVNVVYTLGEDGTATAKATGGDSKVVESAPRAGNAKQPESK